MNLVEKICSEIGVSKERLMLLRHSSGRIERLRRFGGSVEEYTAIQPVGSKYDFHHHLKPPINLVAVIVEDELHGVFRVEGVKREGSACSLGSDEFQAFVRKIDKPERQAREYNLVRIPTRITNWAVTGWKGRERTTVQRSDGKFFDQIEVSLPTAEETQISFEKQVEISLRDSADARRARLANAPSHPSKIQIQTTVFDRNPDVVAEVLHRANGKCAECGENAPFVRRSSGTPYLEVHHKIPLAQQGRDDVANATALCPNCHRRAHFGPLP